MSKKIVVFLVSLSIIFSGIVIFSSCSKEIDPDTVIARMGNDDILWQDISDDVKFVIGIQDIDVSDKSVYTAVVLDVLNTYMIDLMCEKECDSLGIGYNKEYYSEALVSLFEAYGSEKALLDMLSDYDLDRSYVEKVCKRQARKATLYEHIIDEIVVEESEIMEYYFASIDDFHENDVRDIHTIYYAEREEAQEALEQISEIGFLKFYENVDVKEDGTVGVGETAIFKATFDKVTRSEFEASIAETIFTLPSDSFHAEPISCAIGYALIYVGSIYEDYTFTYDEMAPYIEEAIAEDKADEITEKFFEDLNKKYQVEVLYPEVD